VDRAVLRAYLQQISGRQILHTRNNNSDDDDDDNNNNNNNKMLSMGNSIACTIFYNYKIATALCT